MRDRGDGLVLTHDALVEHVLHPQQLGRLLLGEVGDGHAGPHRDDLGDLLLGHLDHTADVGLEPLLFHHALLGEDLLLDVAQRGGLLELLGLDRGFLLGTHLAKPVVDLAHAGRRRHHADAHLGARLVDEVDRLVGQEAVRDVAVGECRRRIDRVVGDRDAVVRLVAVAQPLEDLDRLGDGGLAHLDGLETALERRVLLDVLAVLVERGRTDRLQLAAGKRRLDDAGGVDRALGRTCAHERVHLVDEQDDVAALADLLHDLLQAVLELTAVLASRDERCEVERVELLVLDGLRHLVARDALREPLGHGGLADARFPDEHGVVLGAARQDLHHALDLVAAPDDRVELALAGLARQVAAELVEYRLPAEPPRRSSPISGCLP